jgi:hypothetical protein
MMEDPEKYQEYKELEWEYIKQFPNSEKPSNSMYELGVDFLLDGLKNRNGKKIRIVHNRKVCDGGKIVYYTPNGN